MDSISILHKSFNIVVKVVCVLIPFAYIGLNSEGKLITLFILLGLLLGYFFLNRKGVNISRETSLTRSTALVIIVFAALVRSLPDNGVERVAGWILVVLIFCLGLVNFGVKRVANK